MQFVSGNWQRCTICRINNESAREISMDGVDWNGGKSIHYSIHPTAIPLPHCPEPRLATKIPTGKSGRQHVRKFSAIYWVRINTQRDCLTYKEGPVAHHLSVTCPFWI